jgi:DNA repair protein SbcC/Rad50
MRPLRLELSGFTCFREHTSIDFSDLELFAIVGQTGAGKSSILDALTFALFEKTPRLGNKPAKELMSQGSLGMSLALEFEASDGRIYRVARLYTQKGSEPRFERKEGEKWVTVSEKTKKTDIASAIEAVVGLDFEAFTKAVLLPQGEFDRFLRGKPDERRSLLKSLIGLERIEAMQKRAGELSREAKSQSLGLQIQLEGLQNATPEALAALQDQQQQTQTSLQHTSQHLEQTRTMLLEARDIERLLLGLDHTQAELKRLLEQQQAVQDNQKRLLEARRVAGVLPLLDSFERFAKRLVEQQQQAANQQKSVDHAQHQTQIAQEALETARDAALATPELERQVEALSALLPRLERLHSLGGRLEAAQAGSVFSESAWSELERLEAELPNFERLGKQLEDLERRREQLKASQHKLHAAEDALSQQQDLHQVALLAAAQTQSELEQAQAAAQAIPQLEQALRQLEALRPQLERLHSLGGGLEDADPSAPEFSESLWARLGVVQSEYKTFTKLQKNSQQLQTDLETAQRDVQHWKSQYADSQMAVDTARDAGQDLKASLEALERDFERAKRDDAAAALLHNAKLGDPCPICGQPLQTLPDVDVTKLASLQTALENNKLHLEQMRERFLGLRETASNHKASLASAEKTAIQTQAALVANLLECQQLLESWLDVLPDGLLAANDPKSALQHAKAAQLAGLAYKLVQAGAADLEQRSQSLEQQKQALQRSVQQAQSKHTQAQNSLARAESALHAATALVATRQSEHESAQEEGLRLERQRLEVGAERQKWRAKLESALGNSQNPRQVLQQAKAMLLAGFATELVQAGATNRLQADIEALRLQRRQLETAEQHAKEAYSSAKAQLAAAQAAWSAAQKNVSEAQTDVNHAEEVAAQALAGLGLSAAVARASALPEAKIHELEVGIQQHQQAVAAAEQRQRDLEQQLAGRSLPKPVVLLVEEVQALEAQTQHLRGALGRLEAEESQLRQNLQTVKDLRRQQNALEKRHDTYGVLALDLRGNEFQDYLLSGVQQQLLAKATRTMQRITKQRYSLELIDSEFQVRDAWNGLEARGVKTLSGGESFIASLCLALSLSDYLAGNQALGALFLDEGFGTLDSEALEMVASTLEGLNTEGRMVGVITHVPTLAERLPVRLMIEKLQDSSRIKWDRD